MSLDYSTLDLLRSNHPAWRLLRADHAPLIASFLHRTFIAPNVRVMAQADLEAALDNYLFALRAEWGREAFPKAALLYLNDWAETKQGWLRKFYQPNSDEPYFDLTPATEKAIAWLGTLTERSFVGTESRLLTLFDLLKQMSEGSEKNPAVRIAELQKRRDEIDREMARIVGGELPLLNSTELKDRFQQFTQISREILSDFREVEHNFRGLDRRVRERIARWEGSKGALLAEILGEREAISDSDQGRSFRAFWDFLMSRQRQEELSTLLERVLSLSPVTELQPDARTRWVHYDWLEAGEHTQRTVAQLSQQLRRFLDDRVWLENRRIIDLLRGIEQKALTLRAAPPAGEVMQIADTAADITLPLERPLHTPKIKPVIADVTLEYGAAEAEADALYAQIVIDKAQLARHIRHALQAQSQISLRELCDSQPLQHGLAELVTYLQLANEGFSSVVDESVSEVIGWRGADDCMRQARLPRVIFVRS